jgi:hypothetical protein
MSAVLLSVPAPLPGDSHSPGVVLVPRVSRSGWPSPLRRMVERLRRSRRLRNPRRRRHLAPRRPQRRHQLPDPHPRRRHPANPQRGHQLPVRPGQPHLRCRIHRRQLASRTQLPEDRQQRLPLLPQRRNRRHHLQLPRRPMTTDCGRFPDHRSRLRNVPDLRKRVLSGAINDYRTWQVMISLVHRPTTGCGFGALEPRIGDVDSGVITTGTQSRRAAARIQATPTL